MRELPEVRYARLLKPFPTRRLQKRVLWQVLGQAHEIEQELQRLLVDPPSTPEPWCEALYRICQGLSQLADLCDEAGPLVDLMIEQSDGEYQRSLDALVAIMRGLPAEPEAAAA